MWDIISIALLLIEILLLAGFVIGRFRNKKLNETFLFLGLVFLINLALYLVPLLYNIVVLKTESNYVFDILTCITSAVTLFLGGINTGAVASFTLVVPSFTYTYLLGALLALLATVSAAVEAFSHTIRNSFRLAKALKAPTCDLVLGNSEPALQYAKSTPGAVVLLGDSADKNSAVALIEKGYVILRKSYSKELLQSRNLNAKTRYNIICPKEKEAFFEYINTFIAYKKAETQKKNIFLYVEMDESKAETIRREIIEKSGCEDRITAFSSNELLARTFTEAHPVTQFLPGSFLDEDTSVRPDVKINVFLLGFGTLSQELYRQSVLNNQLVKFEDGEYKVFPIRYHIYDTHLDSDGWNTAGLEKALAELAQTPENYFPIPELPYETVIHRKAPHFRETLAELTTAIRADRTFSLCIVDTGDHYRNIETGTRLRSMLDGASNFHIFIRSDASYVQNSDRITYYGDFSRIFTHDVIVNDSLSAMAKKLNQVYTAQQLKARSAAPDFGETVRKQAEESWNALNYFTRYSNIHAAMNLRLKLNLLGLDYVKNGKGENTGLISRNYQRRDGDYRYAEYFGRSKRNALLAQEHARWNAYHLLAEYLPLEKSGITVRSAEGQTVRFNTKNVPAKKHACLTTFKGLDALSSHLAEAAGEITHLTHQPKEYDYYAYDEMLITSAPQLMTELGCSITEK